MKVNQEKKKITLARTKSEATLSRNKIVFFLPPGVKFSDMYMDASQVAQELSFSKRTVRNNRVSGRLSYTTLFGKIFYFRQEIASILVDNKVAKTKFTIAL